MTRQIFCWWLAQWERELSCSPITLSVILCFKEFIMTCRFTNHWRWRFSTYLEKPALSHATDLQVGSSIPSPQTCRKPGNLPKNTRQPECWFLEGGEFFCRYRRYSSCIRCVALMPETKVARSSCALLGFSDGVVRMSEFSKNGSQLVLAVKTHACAVEHLAVDPTSTNTLLRIPCRSCQILLLLAGAKH